VWMIEDQHGALLSSSDQTLYHGALASNPQSLGHPHKLNTKPWQMEQQKGYGCSLC
jgi:hypothetical protein